MTVADMLAEAVLPQDIDPGRTRPRRRTGVERPADRRRGFIGAYLLAALVEAGAERVVICLDSVRANGAAEARARVDEALAAPPTFRPRMREPAPSSSRTWPVRAWDSTTGRSSGWPATSTPSSIAAALVKWTLSL